MTKRLGERLIKPSTRALWRERKSSGIGVGEWLHGYIYTRWPYLYIGSAKGEHPLSWLMVPFILLMNVFRPFTPGRREKFRRQGKVNFADSYHGKPMPLDEAVKLVRVDRPVTMTLPESVLPYPVARDIVLQNPDHIAVLDCPCRAHAKTPCTPLDVCIVVGEPFASFVVEHHPKRSRWITPDEAVDILKAEDARGHVHHAFFKDGMLGRFYAICNCCSCCCGAMEAQRNGVEMLCSSGYVCELDAEACVACGNCVQYCQFGAISSGNGVTAIDADKCFGCGVCTSKCPKDALTLRRDPSRGEPLLVADMLGGEMPEAMRDAMEGMEGMMADATPDTAPGPSSGPSSGTGTDATSEAPRDDVPGR